jgi:Nitronate monooxygenase
MTSATSSTRPRGPWPGNLRGPSGPAAVFLSFGDPAPFASLIRRAGTRLICQVQDVAGARQAAAAGADVIVAQGTEAGGHGSRRSALPLVPAVADAAYPVPVLAAGGIADGRGVAAALMLGAQGAVLGTRFCATPEALCPDWVKAQLVAHGGIRRPEAGFSTSPGAWTGLASTRAGPCAMPSPTPGTDARQNCEQAPAPGNASPRASKTGAPTWPWSGPEKGSTSSPPSSPPETW